MDKWLGSRVKVNLEVKDRRNWKVILPLVMLRAELLRWRAEKWIREFLTASKVKWEEKWEVEG
jgi:hypothetical protein